MRGYGDVALLAVEGEWDVFCGGEAWASGFVDCGRGGGGGLGRGCEGGGGGHVEEGGVVFWEGD